MWLIKSGTATKTVVSVYVIMMSPLINLILQLNNVKDNVLI